MTNIVKEIRANEKAIAELRAMVIGKPETIETIKAISAGTCDGTARFMEKVAFAQSDLDILSKKVKEMEADIQKIKNYINRYL